ncbi:HNH endonuclease [Caulobacter segnis]
MAGLELSPEHRSALDWFDQHAGDTVAWSELNRSEQRLAIMPKGIYRPAGWPYSLSIKIIPNGAYPDEAPQRRNGVVTFRYHQETPKAQDPISYFTNEGLNACLRDGIPVGVIRRAKPKPNPLYEVLGLGRVTDWSEGFFTIELLEPGQSARSSEPIDLSGVDETPAVSMEDARTKIAQAIVRRRGQAKFRAALMRAYGGQCVVSGCTVAAVLEAAHIKPYLGDHSNVVQNGLLLRGDLHTLFDLKLLQIDPKTRTVVLSQTLEGTEYWAFHGRALTPPERPSDAPAQDCLDFAWTATSVL